MSTNNTHTHIYIYIYYLAFDNNNIYKHGNQTKVNYELDAYLDALKAFPKSDIKLYTDKGNAVCQKTDIFKGLMWYAYEGEWMNWHVITTAQANEIIEKNKKKEKVANLEEYAAEHIEDAKNEFENVVGQDSLTRFDSPKPKNKRKNNKNNRNNKNRNNKNKSQNRNSNQKPKPKAKTNANVKKD